MNQGFECPSCGRKRGLKEIDTMLWECPKCRCIFGTLSLGESYSYVLPWMTEEEVPDERIRPYDFRCLGCGEITRRHGWYDTETKLIVQVG